MESAVTTHRLRRRSALALLALATPLGGGLATTVAASPYPWREEPARETIRRHSFPDITLRTHLGKPVRFYQDLIRDKFVILNFMYINCADGSCPVTTYNLRMVQPLLHGRIGHDVNLYSITLDPERDSVEMLRNYAEVHRVGPGWTFLRAAPKDTDVLRRALGFYDRDPVLDAQKSTHVAMVRFGNEPRAQWGSVSGLSDPRRIAQAVNAVWGAERLAGSGPARLR